MIDDETWVRLKTLPVDARLEVIRQLLASVEADIRDSGTNKTAQPELATAALALSLDQVGLEGGRAESIDHLRLVDATDYLRLILRKYGYIKVPPSFSEMANTAALREADEQRWQRRAAWAGWVARDGDKIDGPPRRDWGDWLLPNQKPKT